MDQADVLSRVEQQLRLVRRHRGRSLIRRWADDCPRLVEVEQPVDVPEWVWGLDRKAADDVFRGLVKIAQGGDGVALLTVLACLRPGLLSLSRRLRIPVDDLISDATHVVLRFPLARRRSVAGQLLLDIRQCYWSENRRPEVPVDGARGLLEVVRAPGELGSGMSAAEQLLRLVVAAWRVGVIGADDARLVVEFRVLGDPMATAAARRGIRRGAAFERLYRTERLLTCLVGGRPPFPLESQARRLATSFPFNAGSADDLLRHRGLGRLSLPPAAA